MAKGGKGMGRKRGKGKGKAKGKGEEEEEEEEEGGSEGGGKGAEAAAGGGAGAQGAGRAKHRPLTPAVKRRCSQARREVLARQPRTRLRGARRRRRRRRRRQSRGEGRAVCGLRLIRPHWRGQAVQPKKSGGDDAEEVRREEPRGAERSREELSGAEIQPRYSQG